MNCSNCGAPMKFVDGRNYFVCEHCTTFHFTNPDQDGVQVLEQHSRAMCPRCQTQLAAATVEGKSVLHCETCKGLLATNGAFGHIVSVRRDRSGGSTVSPVPFDPQELDRRIACPACQRLMDTHPYGGPGPVVVDTCPECEFIWVDHGELAKIERAPGARW
jgi:Zn-finger nucleic acid-binding protein